MRNTIFPLAIAFIAVLAVSACKNTSNDIADRIDGTWELDSWTYEGKDSIPAGVVSDSLGTWTFTTCKASIDECEGTQTGFLGGTEAETFIWFVREEGTKFSMGDGSLSDEGASMAQLTGEWDILGSSDTKLTLKSTNCGMCVVRGQSTIVFSRQ